MAPTELQNGLGVWRLKAPVPGAVSEDGLVSRTVFGLTGSDLGANRPMR